MFIFKSLIYFISWILSLQKDKGREIHLQNIQWRIKVGLGIAAGRRLDSYLNYHSSKVKYDKYKERDFEDEVKAKKYYKRDGGYLVANMQEIRKYYLKNVISSIEELIPYKEEINVLEVGCGNAINLLYLKNKFLNNRCKINLEGFDISSKRLDVGRDKYGADIESINLYQGNSIFSSSYKSKIWDIIFSVCSLEQLSNAAPLALKQMIAAGKTIIVVEPMPEIGSSEQGLYNLFTRQSVGLLNEIFTNKNVTSYTTPEIIEVLHYPFNPVGSCIIKTKN
jgi:SAM-dependent methyltransferase